MARLVWLTDLHLNFVRSDAVGRLADEIRAERPDALLVGGDTGEAHDVFDYLGRLADSTGVPVYYVLGNHDYYRGSIAGVRAASAGLGRPELINMSQRGPVFVTPNTALVGHDGWGDGRLGNAESTPVVLNDVFLIEELQTAAASGSLLAELGRLGDEGAAHLRAALPPAHDAAGRVIILTHVPPFAGAAWHDGKTSDADWLPFFACQAVGEAILEIAADYPAKRILVLCGHTHGEGVFRAAANVEVWTGGAAYGRPKVRRVIEVD